LVWKRFTSLKISSDVTDFVVSEFHDTGTCVTVISGSEINIYFLNGQRRPLIKIVTIQPNQKIFL